MSSAGRKVFVLWRTLVLPFHFRVCYNSYEATLFVVPDDKRTKISELLQYIEERLAELEEEKEELKEFQEKDKERRCLEYALYWREVEEVGEALEEVRRLLLRSVEVVSFSVTTCSLKKNVNMICTLPTSVNVSSASERRGWRSAIVF